MVLTCRTYAGLAVWDPDVSFRTMKTTSLSTSNPPPRWRYRKFGWTGFDIGCHEIRMAQVESTSDGWCIDNAWTLGHPTPNHDQSPDPSTGRERFAWIPPEGLIESGLRGVESELRKFRDVFSGRNCAVSLHDGMVDYREIAVPRGDYEEMHSMAHSEILLESASDADALISQCWEIRSTNSPSSNQAVMATVSMKTDASYRFAEDLSRAGWECRVLDAIPCALARSSSMATGNPQIPVLTLEMGYAQAILLVVIDGQPAMMRCLSKFGTKGLFEQVAASFAVTPTDAQTLLCHENPGVRNQLKDAFLEKQPLDPYLHSFADGLCAELNRTLHYVELMEQNSVPVKILMSGAGTEVAALPSLIASKLPVETELWSIPINGHVSMANRLSTYAIAAGLSALRWEAN